MPAELHIIGGGGHAAVVADAALRSGHWASLWVYDDKVPNQLPVAARYGGPVEKLMKKQAALDVVVALGNSDTRLALCGQILGNRMRLVSVVHPQAVVAQESVNLGAGSVVFAGAIINPGVESGLACIFNSGSVVDHHCQLGEGVHICPGTTLAGRVTVGDHSWIGVGATVRDGVSIGAHALIGAGAVVVDNIQDNVTATGCPAKPIKSHEQ